MICCGVGFYVSEVHRALRVPVSHLGQSTWKTSPMLTSGLSDEIWNAVSRICIPLMLSENPSHSLIPSSWALLRIMDGKSKKWSSLAASHTAGVAWHSRGLIFCCGEEHGLRRSLLALSCVTSGKGNMSKVKSFFLPSSILLFPLTPLWDVLLVCWTPGLPQRCSYLWVTQNCCSLGKRQPITPILPFWWHYSIKLFLLSYNLYSATNKLEWLNIWLWEI